MRIGSDNNDAAISHPRVDDESHGSQNRVYPYFEDFLDHLQRGTQLPLEIRIWRNRAIIALFVQVAVSITGLTFYSIRRMRVGQVVNLICILLVLFAGSSGALKLQKYKLAIHGVLTSSIFGVVFLYSILEAVLQQGDKNNDQLMLLIFCLPYLADFIAGVILLYLANMLFSQDAENAKMEIPALHIDDSQLCVICAANKINTVFYTCGHKASCYPCSVTIKNSYQMKCPICRKIIQDIILVYE